MLKLSLDAIRALADNEQLFREGFKIHSQRGIVSVTPHTHHGFDCVLLDLSQKTYTLKSYFSANTGEYLSAHCSCHGSVPCAHSIAMLLYMLYKKDELVLNLSENNQLKMYDQFLEVLIDQPELSIQELLKIELTLYPSERKRKGLYLSMRAGTSVLYVIKNVEAFVKAISEGTHFEINKQLTFDPSLHNVSLESRRIVDLFLDYFQTRDYLKHPQYEHAYTTLSPGKLLLPEHYINKLLRLLDQSIYHLDIDGFYLKNMTTNHELSIGFFITEESGKISIAMNTYDVLYSLTTNHEFVFYNNCIFNLNHRQRKAFQLISDYFTDKNMDVPKSHLSELINQLVPVLELIGYVEIEPEIIALVEEGPFKCTLHLDKFENTVEGSLSFEYGQHFIPIIPDAIIDEDSLLCLKRDIQKESKIIKLLKQSHYSINQHGRFTYKTEDELFHFLFVTLKELQKDVTVLYSEDFRSLYVDKQQRNLSLRVHYDHQLDLLDFDFDDIGLEEDELRGLLQAIIEKKKYYTLKEGSFYAITEQLSQQMHGLMDGLNLSFEQLSRKRVPLKPYHALYLDTLFDNDNGMSFSVNEGYRQLLDAIMHPEETEFIVPKSLDPILREYQKTGFRWLSALHHFHLGGILADDMGLGKTLEAIALILSTKTDRPTLVVAPTSLIYNWEEEVHRFAPTISTLIVAGTKFERSEQIKCISTNTLVITSYGALKRDLKEYQSYHFQFCILDEAQHIKNPSSQNAQAVKGIHAQTRFALTGTPIENTLAELWSIFDFILPGYLGTYSQFVHHYERAIAKENDTQRLLDLNKMIRPFILRRLKEDVLTELPPKIETKMMSELTKHQKKLYAAYLQESKLELMSTSTLPKSQQMMKILALLTRLRQICCHPSLFIENYTHDSAKLEQLLELIQDGLEAGHRILVFSQFTSMLKIIQEHLTKMHIEYFYLDGSLAPKERQHLVHDFNVGLKDVFLISLKAGGTGLNLTGADMVIHYDPWWNPAVENQATDRAYRIGQKKVVQVYKLITAGTIEEKIFALQQRKQNLIENVIQPGETFITKLSQDEIKALFD